MRTNLFQNAGNQWRLSTAHVTTDAKQLALQEIRTLGFNLIYIASLIPTRGKTHLGQCEGNVSQGWQSIGPPILGRLPIICDGWGVWQVGSFPGKCSIFHHNGWVTASPMDQVGLRILDPY